MTENESPTFQIAEYGITVGRATTVHATYTNGMYPLCGSVHRGRAYFSKAYQPTTCQKCIAIAEKEA